MQQTSLERDQPDTTTRPARPASSGGPSCAEPATGEMLPAGRAGADPARRRDLGAFYTPAHVVDYMLAQLSGLDGDARLLEPSGGDGAFVLPLLRRRLLDPDQITVCDIDPQASAAMSQLGVTARTTDTLLSPPTVPGGYTHVLGNPPYLGTHSHYVREHRDQLRERYEQIGSQDTYAMFTLAGLRLLAAGGQLALLLSDTFMTLGAHRAFRRVLLEQYTVESLTLLPRGVFTDASVGTAVLCVRNADAPAGHHVRVRDLRENVPGDYTGPTRLLSQRRMRALPAHEITPTPEALHLLETSAACEPLMTRVDGGLGMYTRNNRAFVARVEAANAPTGASSSGPVRHGRYERIRPEQVDGRTWRAYHKLGGDRRWWAPVDHAIRWDAASRGSYTVPVTGQAGSNAAGQARDGVVLSGVATTLTARLAIPGAMWESNKVFGLFPKDPSELPVLALLALLNSRPYAQVAAALNHTISLQYRDVARLPLLPATPAELGTLTELAEAAVSNARQGVVDPHIQTRLDALVQQMLGRALTR